MKKVIFLVLAMVIAVYLICLANEKRPSQNLKENKSLPSENWKEYESLVGIWPQLKKEQIENIRFCTAISLEYGYDLESDFEENAEPSGYREIAADVVRWWPTIYKVPKENLPECIEIIDKVVKDTQRLRSRCSSLEKMLIVTGKGNYIFPKEEWMSDKLSEFLVKYCKLGYERWYFVPPKERTAAILIFSERKYDPTKSFSAHDSQLIWPPVALFGDKKLTEELLCRSFEPNKIFEGRDWLEKIITEYEIALKDAEEKHYRRNDSSALKSWIVFLTQDEFYWMGIGIDEGAVIGEYIIGSKQLKAYFDELGLTKEILAGELNARRKASQGE